jgi:hypothetical protein
VSDSLKPSIAGPREWDSIHVPVNPRIKERVRQFSEADGVSTMAAWVRRLVVAEVSKRERRQTVEAR